MATMTDKELDRWWINATEGLYIGNGQPYTPSAMPEEASANIKHLIKQYAASELEALANDIATQARDDEHAFWEVERVKLQERANAQLEQFVGEVKERLKVGGRRGAEGFYIISIIDTLATKYLQSGKGEQ